MLEWKIRTLRLSLRRIASFVFSALSFWGVAVPALAQHQSHETHEDIGWVPREILERPVPLRQGIGIVHEKVTTSSPLAQAFYDQGLAYLNSYVWIEAARSFHQALRLDTGLAMACVGLSDVYVGLQDVAAARAALQEAQRLGLKATERERRRIEIRARQIEYLEDSGDIKKYFAYRQAISDALALDPADPWLWILRGFADEGTPTGHGQGGGVDTIAFYETALALSAGNFAAHHYLIHSFENIGRTDEALVHAEAYVRLAPAIPHAHHMYGHDLRRAGRTEEAIIQFRKADDLENAYYLAEKIHAELDWHHAHNLSLLAMCYQTLGQMQSAEKLFREIFSLPTYTDLADFNRREWPEFLMNRGRPEEALEAARDLVNSHWTMGRFAGHTLTGRALLALNRVEEAKGELTLAERETEQLPTAVLKWLPDAAALHAELMLREQKPEGNSLMKQIEEQLQVVPGPDAWSQALFDLEAIADVARDSGDWELSEFSAQKMIQQDPSYAGGHYALALVAEHRNDAVMARQEFAAAEKLWDKADPDLPELTGIRQKLSARRAPAS